MWEVTEKGHKLIANAMITLLVIGIIIAISFGLVWSLYMLITDVDWHRIAYTLGAVAGSFMEGLGR